MYYDFTAIEKTQQWCDLLFGVIKVLITLLLRKNKRAFRALFILEKKLTIKR